MKKNKKSTILNYKLPFFLVALIASVIFMANTVLVEDYFNNRNVLGASTKSKGNSSNDKKVNPSVAKKLDTNIPNTVKAQTHALKVKEIVMGLEDIAVEEGEVGDEEVGEEIEDIAEDIESIAVDATESIDDLEERPGWKTFLLGTDYKNLGQLRSTLVHSENNIRKITQTMARVEGADSDTALQERLGELNQERNRIIQIIQEEEGKFSLLGWVSKLLSGYTGEDSETDTEIDEVVESSEPIQ